MGFVFLDTVIEAAPLTFQDPGGPFSGAQGGGACGLPGLLELKDGTLTCGLQLLEPAFEAPMLPHNPLKPERAENGAAERTGVL